MHASHPRPHNKTRAFQDHAFPDRHLRNLLCASYLLRINSPHTTRASGPAPVAAACSLCGQSSPPGRGSSLAGHAAAPGCRLGWPAVGATVWVNASPGTCHALPSGPAATEALPLKPHTPSRCWRADRPAAVSSSPLCCAGDASWRGGAPVLGRHGGSGSQTRSCSCAERCRRRARAALGALARLTSSLSSFAAGMPSTTFTTLLPPPPLLWLRQVTAQRGLWAAAAGPAPALRRPERTRRSCPRRSRWAGGGSLQE